MADFQIKQHNTSPAILDQLSGEDDRPVDVTGSTVRFVMVTIEGTRVEGEGEVYDGKSGKVAYRWGEGDTQVPGNYMGEWRVTFPDGKVESFPNGDYKRIRVKPAL